MPLSKKSLSELEKLISEMSNDQLDALFSELGAKVLSNATLEYLTETRDGINEMINKAQEALRDEKMKERDELIARIATMNTQFNLPFANIPGISPPAKRIVRERLDGAPGDGRAKPEIKFRNPKNHSETWKARGKRPSWLIRELATRGMNETADIPAEFHVANQS